MTHDLPPAGAVRPMPALQPDRVRELLLEWCDADEADADAAAGAARLEDEAFELADRMYQTIAADMGGRKWLQWPKPPADQPLLGLYPILAAIPLMRDYHRKLHLDEAFSRQLLADVGEKLRLNRKIHGTAGLDAAFWFTAHVRGTIYQLGRLQFCVEGTETSPLIGLHIRGEGGPLTPEAVRDSVERALAFFPSVFPERFHGTDDLRFTCESWLLDPQLRDWLPEDSNILKFAALFDLIGPEEHSGPANRYDVWRFVFARTEDTPAEDLPTDNTLQRSVKAGIEAGTEWHNRIGQLDLARLGL